MSGDGCMEAGTRERSMAETPGWPLAKLVEQALAGRGLDFVPALEARFEQDTESERRRFLRNRLLAAVLVFTLFQFDDYFIAPDAFWASAALRFGIVVPALLAAAMMQSLRLTPLAREFTAFSCAVLVALDLAAINLISGAPNHFHLLYGFLLLLVYANVFVQLRFRFAAATGAVTLAIVLALLPANAATSTAVKVNLLLMVTSAVSVTLVGNYRLEWERRQTYLLRLRETLRGDDLSARNQRLQDLSYRDWLTGLANRRLLEHYLEEAFTRGEVGAGEIGMLMLDVDFFKNYNDRYGHPAGDACLQALATLLRGHMRAGVDLLARYGGEEFLAVLPGQGLPACLRIAERIRRAVEEAALPHEASPNGLVTLSIGVVAGQAGLAMDPETLIQSADAALYAAKQAGRNRIWPGLAQPAPRHRADRWMAKPRRPGAGHTG